MSCECDHTVCCGLLSASDTASASLRELYRRPARRRFPRYVSRRRLLHQHMSCPNNCVRSDELSTTSADELNAWASRRTRSDLPPLGAARYKTDRSRYSMRPPRACPLTSSRRTPSRHRRTTTIVHHPCCLFDPKLCPVMKGSHHRQTLRPEDIDSDTLRTTEELRSHIESFLYHHKRRKPQNAPCQPDATTQVPGTVPQYQSKQTKSAQQSDHHEKKCEICGNSQHVTESRAQFAQRYVRQPSPPPASPPLRPADLLPREVSSETADRLVDELSRRSAGPRATHSPHRASMGDFMGQQRNFTSGAATNVFPASPAAAGSRKGETSMMPNIKQADIALSPPSADVHKGYTSIQNMPRPRSTANSPFLEEYFSRRPSNVLEHSNERRPPTAIKTGPPMTQLDVETSYTMHSIASARAATTKNPDNATPRRYVPSGAYSHEEVGSQPENVAINFQRATRRAASEGAKPADDVVSAPSPAKGVFTFGGQDADDSRNKVGRVDPEFRIMPQSEPDSARYTAGTYETDVSELQQTGNHTAAGGSSSSNGDFQSGNETPVDSGGGGSLRHMDGVEKALKSWQTSGGNAAQVSGANSRTDKISSPVPSIYQGSAAGDVNHLSGCERASRQASPSSRKSVMSPAIHRGEGNHQEAGVRKSRNSIHNNINVGGSDDSAVYSRHSYVESLNKPEGTSGTSFCTDGCGSSMYRSNSQQGDKQQEAARNSSRGGTPPAESGCKSTPNAEEKVVASSRASSRSGSIATSTKTARRRAKDRGEGDAKGDVSQSDYANCEVTIASHLSVAEQVEASRVKIIECIDKALAYIVGSPVTDLYKYGSQAKLQSASQLMGRSNSLISEHGDSSDVEPQRECSSLELSSELWTHLDTTVKDSLGSLPQQHASKGAVSSAEDRNNRKLLLKLQRDLTKNILTNLKRLEDIESLLHPSNGEGPSDPPTK